MSTSRTGISRTMTLAIKHNFVSPKADGTDPTLLKPSYWNDSHAITLGTNMLIGRASAGSGTAEEIPTSAAVIALLASADLPALIAAMGISPPTTGDGKLTLKVAADAGWLMLDDGTFGNAGSGGSNRANADCLALFTLIYNNLVDANAVVFTSAGVASTRAAQGSAATAWAALCRLSLPKQLGRAFVAAGTGSGLTARALGSSFGEESHVLTSNEMPSHYHVAGISDPGHFHSYTLLSGGIRQDGTQSATVNTTFIGATTGASISGVRVSSPNGTDTTSSTGGGATHNNTQASTAWNVMVKL